MSTNAREALTTASRGYVKAYAAELGMSRTRFRAYTDNPEVRNPIETVNKVLKTARSISPERLHVLIAPLLDGIPVRVVDDLKPEPADANLVMAESSDLIGVLSRAFADGQLTSDERAAILKEGREAERVIGGLLAALGGK